MKLHCGYYTRQNLTPQQRRMKLLEHLMACSEAGDITEAEADELYQTALRVMKTGW